MPGKVICINKSPCFRLLKGNAKSGCKKIVSIIAAKLEQAELQRLDALEVAIEAYLVEGFNPLEERVAIFDLSGGSWYLQGNGLSLPQMRELKKRFKNWDIKEKNDRLGKFLELTPKPDDQKPA